MNLNIERWLGIATMALAACSSSTVAQAADIGVSVSISQPGIYGRVDLGRFPQPAIFVQRPVIVHRGGGWREPVHMWVPPGHRQNWDRHCGRYRACGSPVYFVRDSGYAQQVRRHPGQRDEWRRDDRGRLHEQRHHGRHDRRGRHD